MKSIFLRLCVAGIIFTGFYAILPAQVPAGFQYQAVARDADGNPLNEKQVSLRFSLLPGSETADAVYTETHSVTTNRFGLITLHVGDGSVVTGDIESVDWSSTPMYLKVDMDPSGGNNYAEMGTSRLLSVPYALHAASGVQGPPGPEGPPGPQGETGTGLTGRGSWVTGTTYEPGDYVFDRSSDDEDINSMWIMQSDGPIVSDQQPFTDPDNWIEFQSPQGEPGLLQAGSEPGNTPYWDGEQWVTGSSNLFNNGGNIGIGTTSPTQALDIDGNMRLRSHLYDRTNSMGTTGQVLTRTATGVLWNDAVSGTGSTGNLAYWTGTRQLGSIPYIIYSEDESVQIASKEDAGDDDPIFEVKNRHGQVVLGVYQTGVRIYVDEVEESKGSRGGFAVGGFTASKSDSPVDFMWITSQNYFIGHKSGEANTSGLYNSFLGYETGKSNTTGSNNVFLGYQSGLNNLGGSDPQGSNNVFIGYQSGLSNTTGYYNSFIGYQAGFNSGGSSYNTSIGYQAGYSLNDWQGGAFVGYEAGKNITGRGNTAMGSNAGSKATSGEFNVFIGSLAGTTNDESLNTGSRNVYIGRTAGFFFGSGTNNVAVGYNAGSSATGKGNVFLGYNAGAE